ncbi:uncharacterized protein LOC127861251 isoform X2 [Dreissena polymorpha]|uniref:Uncharacterized protein n=1 Tax=Dreissena polymorpha TaxID=45954 RepID=A0A9D3YIT9_DREPO|nr:uncharacterized protein LOC127861251 isoform X1 [Dreissena polymorpha]XP_052255637.1 uncharacterized protein LOC127861251 isoform X2 [Dreissena polymorpha]KAH3699281.1 hypothetical protein DPMN_074237 [Dreissena polymorpha]
MLSLLLNNSSDKFEIYMAQKLLVAQAKHADIEYQDSLQLIKSVIVKANSPVGLCRGLEMLRQLLKKSKINWRDAVTVFKDAVSQKLHDIAIMDASSLYFTNSCIYEVLYLCHKVLKLVPLYDCQENDAAISLNVILHEKYQVLLDEILFSSRFLNFVKRMLQKFLTNIFMFASKNKLINSVAYEMAERLVFASKRFDMHEVLSQHGVTYFVGVIDGRENADYKGYDPTCIREWMFMCTSLAYSMNLIDGSPDSNEGVKLILDFEAIVSTIAWSSDNSLPYSWQWLPEIFGEQDDMWMDMLILLIKLFPSPKVKGQHHFQFLQFVTSVGYDHVTVLDLLTSPETRCREYMMLYLRHLIHTWQDFIECAYLLEKISGNSNVLLLCKDFTETECEPEKEISGKQNEMCSNDQAENIVTNLFGRPVETDSNEDLRCDMKCSSGGLAMLSAYNDDDESDSDKDQDTEEYDINNLPVQRSNGSILYEDKLNITDLKKVSNIGESVTNIETSLSCPQNCKNSVTLATNVNKCHKVSAIAHHVPCVDEFNDERAGAHDNFSSQQDEISLSEVTYPSDTVLDLTLSMLIRINLKLERLYSAKLLPYNPATLVNLLETVESLYEKHCI